MSLLWSGGAKAWQAGVGSTQLLRPVAWQRLSSSAPLLCCAAHWPRSAVPMCKPNRRPRCPGCPSALPAAAASFELSCGARWWLPRRWMWGGQRTCSRRSFGRRSRCGRLGVASSPNCGQPQFAHCKPAICMACPASPPLTPPVTTPAQLCNLRHANIVTFYGCCIIKGRGVLLTELCEGEGGLNTKKTMECVRRFKLKYGRSVSSSPRTWVGAAAPPLRVLPLCYHAMQCPLHCCVQGGIWHRCCSWRTHQGSACLGGTSTAAGWHSRWVVLIMQHAWQCWSCGMDPPALPAVSAKGCMLYAPKRYLQCRQQGARCTCSAAHRPACLCQASVGCCLPTLAGGKGAKLSS